MLNLERKDQRTNKKRPYTSLFAQTDANDSDESTTTLSVLADSDDDVVPKKMLTTLEKKYSTLKEDYKTEINLYKEKVKGLRTKLETLQCLNVKLQQSFFHKLPEIISTNDKTVSPATTPKQKHQAPPSTPTTSTTLTILDSKIKQYPPSTPTTSTIKPLDVKPEKYYNPLQDYDVSDGLPKSPEVVYKDVSTSGIFIFLPF